VGAVTPPPGSCAARTFRPCICELWQRGTGRRGGHRRIRPARRLAHQREVMRVGVEASGGYEIAVIDAFEARGFQVVRFNARRVRLFAKAKGRLAKNDRADARTIAQAAAVLLDAVPAPRRREVEHLTYSRIGALPMTPAQRQARRRARCARTARCRRRRNGVHYHDRIAGPRRSDINRLAGRIPRLARQPAGQPRRLSTGRQAVGHCRARPRGAARNRPTAWLRPRLIQQVHYSITRHNGQIA
jgi:transposase